MTTFIHHMGALVFVTACAFTGSIVLYKMTNAITPLRVTADEEEAGLDVSQHGEVMDEAAPKSALAFAKSAWGIGGGR